MPFSSYAGTVDPKTDCAKIKVKQQQDSLGIYESENKVPNDVETREIPKSKPVAKQAPAKTFDNKVEESDKVAERDPNSAMSFNIIYYIIDKFKFTDPLE